METDHVFIPKPVESLVNTARPICLLTFGSVVSTGRLPGNRLREISTAFSITDSHQRPTSAEILGLYFNLQELLQNIDVRRRMSR